MSKKLALTRFLLGISFLCALIALSVEAKRFGSDDSEGGFGGFRSVVKSEERETFVDNEYGRISAVNISDGIRGPHHIRFFTLEPNSLLLPLLLHSDMIFYVNTGSGRLSWANEEESKTVELKRGDIFRLQTGSVFFIQSDLETQRQSLRIYALFSNSDYGLFEPKIGAYSSIRDLLRGFDKLTLKQAFQVSDEVIESITSGTDTEAIVHAISTRKDKKEKKKKEKEKKQRSWAMETRILKPFIGLEGFEEKMVNKKKGKKGEVYNLFEEKPDFENCNGWSLTVNPKKAEHVLGETNVGIFMVNLTKGSMMGPHWNPKATEIAIVLQGQGMIRVVCSSLEKEKGSKCKNTRFRVKEGDVFAVPRFHPMAQLSFNNDSFVFMGFTTTRHDNHPQFLAGRQSVLQALDRDILALSFNVPNTTIDRLLAPQSESIILDCTSCAEEAERKMEEEAEKERKEEEAREREEEKERQKREEEEARKRQEEEERERQRQEEEEARRQEEERERQRKEEEERERQRKEEEEARRQEEERERQRQEEEERERQRQEEEERERQRQEEEEEERERQRQEEEEARRQEEERERQREEEEEARRQEEERERQRQEEEEEEARRQEEERERQREEEEEARRQEEQERTRREEEAGREAREREEEERQREEEGGGGGEGRVYLNMWQL